MSSRDAVAATVASLGLAASEAQLEALRRYLAELSLWNRKRDLVKADGDVLIVRHLADSLAGVPVVRRELERARAAQPTGAQPPAASHPAGAAPTLLDLGSGGGFPGVPLAVFLPETRVVLIERAGGKCAFLRSAAAVAGLGTIEVRQADYRTAAREGATSAGARADVIVFRALAEIDADTAAALARLLQPAGAVVAYKGRYARATAEAEAARELFAEVEVVSLDVPGLGEERSLVVLRGPRQDF